MNIYNKRLVLVILLLFFAVCLKSQIATELFVPCYGSSGCIVNSEIEVTSGAVDPPAMPGGPGIINGDGEAIELCYTQSLHVSLGVNWHQGTQIDVGPGWEPIGVGSGVSGPGGGASAAGNYIYYDYSDNCPGQGECGGDPGAVSGGWGWYYESGLNVQCGGLPGDGDASNNYGDFNPAGAAELEFCYEIITDCDGAMSGEIDTVVDFWVYADSEMGTWNSCGCEGGAVECSIPFKIVCCDQAELQGIVADGDCADELTKLEVTGDTNNPNYTYNWQGPNGPGPQGANQPVWNLPDPASPGEYTLLVTNAVDGDCEKMFSINIFAGGDGAQFTGTDACVGAEGSVFIYPDEDSSYDGQFGGPACSIIGVTCGNDPITGIPFVEINQMALQANAAGAPGSAGTSANLIYSVGNSASPCFAFSTNTINFLSGPPAPSVIPETIETCLGADWPGINVSPNEGWEYHWYQVPSFGTDQAVLATGTASLTDWPQHIDNNRPAPNGDPYSLYVTAVNQATGCPGPFTEIEIFVGACPCYDASSLIQAEGEITLCGDASTSDITSVLNDLEDSGDLDVNFVVDADPDGDGVSNNISFEYEYDGDSFSSVSPLAATILQDSNADLCNVLEAEVTIVFNCSSPEQSTDGDPAGAVTFILYPDLEEAILDGDVSVDYDTSCAPGTCLATLVPACLETSSLYNLTYTNDDGNGEIVPYNCSSISAIGFGTLSITFDTDDDGNGCADPVLDGISFSCSTPCLVSDSLSLVDLYNATDGANWTNPWNLNDPVSTWVGITLDETGCSVINIELCDDCGQEMEMGWQLKGSLPNSIGEFSMLETLWIVGNPELTESIPPSIGEIMSLKELVLSENNLKNDIPPDLGDLCQLVRLDLSKNILSGELPPELSMLENIESIDLSGNDIVGLYPPEYIAFCDIAENEDFDQNIDLPEYEAICNETPEGVSECVWSESTTLCSEEVIAFYNDFACSSLVDEYTVENARVGIVEINSLEFRYHQVELVDGSSSKVITDFFGCTGVNFETCIDSSSVFTCRSFMTAADFFNLDFDNDVRWDCEQELPECATGMTSFNGITFDVFPNPSLETLHIHVVYPDALRYRILNAAGIPALSGDLASEHIDISSLRSGIYFLELLNERERLGIRKVVKR